MFATSKSWGFVVAGFIVFALTAGVHLGLPKLDDSQPSITTGFQHACGLDAQGRALCWGSNVEGELGDGTSDTTRAIAMPVATDQTFAFIAAGHLRTCALTGQGRLYCWGSNTTGAIGDGTREHRSTPTAVASSTNFRSVSVGARHTCALTRSGEVQCWGSNGFGELGDGARNSRQQPARVAESRTFTSVSAGLRPHRKRRGVLLGFRRLR